MYWCERGWGELGWEIFGGGVLSTGRAAGGTEYVLFNGLGRR